MKHSNSYFKLSLLAGGALAAFSSILPASAQETAPGMETATADSAISSSFRIDEITVTSRRRSESLQDVPIAVTVLTSQELERAGIESVRDYTNLIPNVTYGQGLNIGRNFLTIRGIGQSVYGPPPAAIIVDGVLQMSPLQFNVDEFDLQQIEVLKGPQGAIYGRNAIAGAINMTTLKPGPDLAAHALASYSRGDEWEGKASVSGPVIPDLLYVLGGVSFTDRRGQVRNITTGTYSDKFEDFTGRLRVVATPGDSFEADIKYTYADTKGGDPNFISSRSGDPAISSDPFDSNVVGTNPRKLHDLSGRFDLDAGFTVATLTLAYVNVKENLTEDLDYLPIDFLAAEQRERQEGFSQELRFASEASQRLRWLFGAYHVRLKSFRGVTIFADPFYLDLAPEPTQADTVIGSEADRQTDETWSGFGQLQYDLTPELILEGSLRYDSDKLRQTAADGAVRRASFDKWQPKGTITYRPSSDLTFYAAVGQGYRSGNLNPSATTFGEPVVAPEVATTYELGAKTRLFDQRLLLNLALFQTDLKNGQFFLFDIETAGNTRINIDKTRIRGLELETAFLVMEGLRVNGSFGYTDPEIKSFTPPAGYPAPTADYLGNRPPRVPKITANFGIDVDIPATDAINVFFRPDYRYTGAYYWDLENDYRRPAYHLVNIRAGVRHVDDRWTVAGFVKNLLNEKITEYYEPFATSGLPTGLDIYSPPVGAIYGLEVAFRL